MDLRSYPIGSVFKYYWDAGSGFFVKTLNEDFLWFDDKHKYGSSIHILESMESYKPRLSIYNKKPPKHIIDYLKILNLEFKEPINCSICKRKS